MDTSFNPSALFQSYDAGRLVPFVGAGMSMPTCVGWSTFVASLEKQAGLPASTAADEAATGLIERARNAVGMLRRQKSVVFVDAIRQAVYSGEDRKIPSNMQALADIHWPLVCTTNYDELYLRATAAINRPRADASWWKIRVLGRADRDCRYLLQHLAFPAQQCLWALQGLLPPALDPQAPAIVENPAEAAALTDQLVIGHAEYRKESHRAPHFRRAFAELYRTRSLLFMGSRLSEPYFRSLFDEIIELSGTPLLLHHAFVPAGALDPEFMLHEYHIQCHEYPKGRHADVAEWLKELRRCLAMPRARTTGWSYGAAVDATCRLGQIRTELEIVHAALPDAVTLPASEAVAISCGRGTRLSDGKPIPLASQSAAEAIGLARLEGEDEWIWENDWVVAWTRLDRSYGIVARATKTVGIDARSPDAIRVSFIAFLELALRRNHQRVHVQLLSAGGGRVFDPWVSLTQMVRAFGEWRRQCGTAQPSLQVRIYVVDPGVLMLLRGGYLDLSEPLDGAAMRIHVQVVERSGEVRRHHQIVKAEATLGTINELADAGDAYVHALPTPHRGAEPFSAKDAQGITARNFGLVSGSTLVIDFRDAQNQGR